jgi:hypothetical protein
LVIKLLRGVTNINNVHEFDLEIRADRRGPSEIVGSAFKCWSTS